MDPITTGAIIGGATKILGGIFGSRSQKRADRRAEASQIAAEQRNNARNDFEYARARADYDNDRKTQREIYERDMKEQFTRLRTSAQKGGFNPLSVLGTGPIPTEGSSALAGAGSGTGVGTSFSAPLASISAIFDGVADASAAFTGETAMKYRNLELQTDLAKIELDQVKADLAASVSATRVASTTSRLGNQARTSRRIADAVPNIKTVPLQSIMAPNMGDLINNKEMEPVESSTIISNEVLDVPRLRVFGVDWKGSGRFSAGGQQEEALGEGFVSDIIGAPITVARLIDMVGFTAGSALSPHIDRIRLNNMSRNRLSVPSLDPAPRRQQTSQQREFMRENYPTVFD